jgi:two-component system OmpR family sensor kinase
MAHSLRARLVVGLVALVFGGLLVAGVATYFTLQGLLLDRVDQQLRSDRYQAMATFGDGPPRGPHPGPPRGGPPGFSTYEARVLGDGTVIAGGGSEESGAARPNLPTPLSNVSGNTPLTVSGTNGSDYRLLVEPFGDSVSYVVVAIPLSEVDFTLQEVVLLEVTIGAAVLVAMAVLSQVIVRAALRPLERMGQTAGAIARGDLGQRVSPASPRSEIGRLGLALNGMLSQIESAFDERTRSEGRLRHFIADASHELRTPLTSIRGYAELLRRGAERSPEDAELARRRIEEEAIRMSVLVDDMLLLARLDQGRPLERDPVDLQGIAHDARADASAVAPARPITLVAGERVMVTGDEMRLRQVVGNLVRNALVYTPPATPIEIGVARRDGRAVLTVADHGPGLPPEVAARVFEPFYRGDAGRSRDRGGAGLGLSIVAAVVAAHQGEVRVTATPGGGATFQVELPVAEAPGTSAQVAADLLIAPEP